MPGTSIPEGLGFRHVCGKRDDMLADAAIKFLQEKRNTPFLVAVSYDNPHNICEWAREQELPWGNIGKIPLEECPSLPQNFAIPPYEPEVIRLVQNVSFDELRGDRFTPDE